MRAESVKKEAPARKIESCLRERGEVRAWEGDGVVEDGDGWAGSWLAIDGRKGFWRNAMSLRWLNW